MKLTIPLPPAINRTYHTGHGRFYKSREAHDWQELAAYILVSQWKHQPALTGNVIVALDMYFNRNSDIDSRIKIVLDTLQMAKVIKNDMDITELFVRKHITKVKPAVVITV